jgi:hypothetical protein
MASGGRALWRRTGGLLVKKRLRRVAHVVVRNVLLNVLVVWPVYSVTYLAGLVVAAATAGWHDGRG